MTYLDHAATTPMLPEAVAALAAALQRAVPAGVMWATNEVGTVNPIREPAAVA
jgi:cysteine sulfinate desulfinase/cysteine desulfurase-like protein